MVETRKILWRAALLLAVLAVGMAAVGSVQHHRYWADCSELDAWALGVLPKHPPTEDEAWFWYRKMAAELAANEAELHDVIPQFELPFTDDGEPVDPEGIDAIPRQRRERITTAWTRVFDLALRARACEDIGSPVDIAAREPVAGVQGHAHELATAFCAAWYLERDSAPERADARLTALVEFGTASLGDAPPLAHDIVGFVVLGRVCDRLLAPETIRTLDERALRFLRETLVAAEQEIPLRCTDPVRDAAVITHWLIRGLLASGWWERVTAPFTAWSDLPTGLRMLRRQAEEIAAARSTPADERLALLLACDAAWRESDNVVSMAAPSWRGKERLHHLTVTRLAIARITLDHALGTEPSPGTVPSRAGDIRIERDGDDWVLTGPTRATDPDGHVQVWRIRGRD